MKRYATIGILIGLLCTGCGDTETKEQSVDTTGVMSQSVTDGTTSNAMEETTSNTTTTIEVSQTSEDETQTTSEVLSSTDTTTDTTETVSKTDRTSKWERLPVSDTEKAEVEKIAIAGTKAMRELNAEDSIKYTNIDMFYYIYNGNESNDLLSEVKKAFSDDVTDLASLFGEIEVHSVHKSNEMRQAIKDNIDNYYDEEAGYDTIYDKFDISEAYIVDCTMTYENGSDTGFVVVVRENGELKLDMCFSWSMEIQYHEKAE